MIQEFSSKNTSINKTKAPKILKEVERHFGWENGHVNLDIGGGRFDILSDHLSEYFAVRNLIFDPYNRTEMHNNTVLGIALSQPVDSVTLSNVLCVIKEREERINVLTMAKSYLKLGGKLYVTCYEGNRTAIGRQTGPDQYQLNQPLKFYLHEINEVFGNSSKKGALIYAEK